MISQTLRAQSALASAALVFMVGVAFTFRYDRSPPPPPATAPLVEAEPEAAPVRERFDAVYESPWVPLPQMARAEPRAVRTIAISQSEAGVVAAPSQNALAAIPEAPLAIPAKAPSRREARALARQEVCAAHGLRKVWVTKWRWRCQH